MKILVDENIPAETVRELRALGHDVRDIRGTPLEGLDDGDLWQLCLHERRMLVTTDRGFDARRRDNHCGILIVALRQPNRDKLHRRIVDELRAAPESEWPRMRVILRDTARSAWTASRD